MHICALLFHLHCCFKNTPWHPEFILVLQIIKMMVPDAQFHVPGIDYFAYILFFWSHSTKDYKFICEYRHIYIYLCVYRTLKRLKKKTKIREYRVHYEWWVIENHQLQLHLCLKFWPNSNSSSFFLQLSEVIYKFWILVYYWFLLMIWTNLPGTYILTLSYSSFNIKWTCSFLMKTDLSLLVKKSYIVKFGQCVMLLS